MTPDQLAHVNRLLTAILAILILIVAFIGLAATGDANRRASDLAAARATVDQMKAQMKVVADQNEASLKDRAALHQQFGEIRESLRRLENLTPRPERPGRTDYVR